jgi:transposase
MPGKQHVVRLTPAERVEVRALLAAGTTPART